VSTARPAKLIRLHLCEADRWEGKPLYEAIIQRCRELQVAGVSVFRGLQGFGESAEIHRAHLLAHDQPVSVTIVESPENVEKLLPELEAMLDTGMISMSDVDVIRVRRAV
jgi:uncharacterized protein